MAWFLQVWSAVNRISVWLFSVILLGIFTFVVPHVRTLFDSAWTPMPFWATTDGWLLNLVVPITALMRSFRLREIRSLPALFLMLLIISNAVVYAGFIFMGPVHDGWYPIQVTGIVMFLLGALMSGFVVLRASSTLEAMVEDGE